MTKEKFLKEAKCFISENREQCLWFIREDYNPENKTGLLKLLTYIERYGDIKTYKKARSLKKWLLLIFNETSAD